MAATKKKAVAKKESVKEAEVVDQPTAVGGADGDGKLGCVEYSEERFPGTPK